MIDVNDLQLIQEKLQLKVLKFFGSENLSSVLPNYRSAMRQELINQLGSVLTINDLKNISNLNQIPQLENHFLSISHCPCYGGAVLSSAEVGFDVESIERLTFKLVSRVSTEQELSLAPEFTFLWCCKEAVFKALQPAVTLISDIEIINWESHSETGLWTYRAQSKKALDLSNNLGFIFKKNNLLVSIYFK